MGTTKSVGSLNIGVTVELAKMQAQFDEMQKRVKTLNTRLNSQFRAMSRGIQSALGAIGVSLAPAALIAFGKSIVDLGSNINDLSQTAGVNAQAFQALSLHFMDSGVSMEELSKAFVLLRKNTQEAVGGNKTMQASFAALGIDAQKLQRLAPERQFEAMAMAIANATDQNKAFGAALDILGTKNAPKLMQSLMTLGTDGFDSIKEKAKDFTLSDEQIKAIDDLGDAIAKLSLQVKGFSAKGVLELFDAIKENKWVQNAMIGLTFPVSLPTMAIQAGKRALTANPTASDMLASGEWQDAAAAASAQKRRAALAAIAPAAPRGDPWGLSGAVQIGKNLNQELAASFQTMGEKIQTSVYDVKTDFVAMAQDMTVPSEALQKKTEDLAQSFREMADPTLTYRKQIGEVNALLAAGKLTTDEASVALNKLNDAMKEAAIANASPAVEQFFEKMDHDQKKLNEKSDEAKRLALDMGWAFSSAFEDAVVSGGKFSDVLKGIEQDIIRIALRAAVTEKAGTWLGGAVGSLFSGMFRAEGGPVGSGQPYIVGERGPELFVPDAAGTVVPNSKLGGVRSGASSPSINITQNFGSGMTRREVSGLIPSIVRATRAAVADGAQRGGGFAKALR